MDLEAHLAYGYNLGFDGEFRIAERGEYDQPNLPWFRTEDPDDPDADVDYPDDTFDDALILALYEQIPDAPAVTVYEDGEKDTYEAEKLVREFFGVTVRKSGGDGEPGFVLAIYEPEHEFGNSVDWAEVMPLDLKQLAALPAAGGWDAKLARVVEILGITPTQDRPRWLVYPTYT